MRLSTCRARRWEIAVLPEPEDVLSLDFEVVDGFRFVLACCVLACCVLWLDAKHGGGTGKRH